jgi:predicted fused transcriptional regulator/phosphomethylpyrimidine kinase
MLVTALGSVLGNSVPREGTIQIKVDRTEEVKTGKERRRTYMIRKVVVNSATVANTVYSE